MAAGDFPPKVRPQLHPNPVVYAIVAPEFDFAGALATVREPEGLTLVVEQSDADEDGLLYEFVGAWITLTVATELSDVGFTARFSKTLTEHGIACNVMAGFHHDHLVVPWDQRHSAMDVLSRL